MKLTDEVFRSFRVAKVFRENTDRINCINFSANGESMIASSNDDSIAVYCCLEGRYALIGNIPVYCSCGSFRPKRTLYSKKYGCDLLQYTHAPNTIIYSSNKVDGEFQKWILSNNRPASFIAKRYYPIPLSPRQQIPPILSGTYKEVSVVYNYNIGHTPLIILTPPPYDCSVVSLMMSPVSDSFLSGSLDQTIRLWDLRSQNCQGLMHLNGRPVASYDPEGLIFAAGIDSRQLKLYDLRTFDKVSRDYACIVLCGLNNRGVISWGGG